MLAMWLRYRFLAMLLGRGVRFGEAKDMADVATHFVLNKEMDDSHKRLRVNGLLPSAPRGGI